MKFLSIFVSCLVLSFSLSAQKIPSPKDFLGYELGESFTRHHQVLAYYEAVASRSSKLSVIPYGESAEGRPLMIAVLTSEKNQQQLDQLKRNNVIQTGLLEGEIVGSQLPIVWLSYNIHGNESSCTEASMKTLYALLTESNPQWLEEMIIILDPCVNPDGRERYINWFKQVRNRTPKSKVIALNTMNPGQVVDLTTTYLT